MIQLSGTGSILCSRDRGKYSTRREAAPNAPPVVAMSLADPSTLIARFPISDMQLPSHPHTPTSRNPNPMPGLSRPMQRRVCSPTSTTPHWAPTQPSNHGELKGNSCPGLARLHFNLEIHSWVNGRAASRGTRMLSKTTKTSPSIGKPIGNPRWKGARCVMSWPLLQSRMPSAGAPPNRSARAVGRSLGSFRDEARRRDTLR